MTRLGSALASAPSAAATVSGSNLTWVWIVAVVAVLALVVAAVLRRQVLAASQGTEKMQEIAKAVQEGAAAYLKSQFKTLGVFVVLLFFVLLILPADTTQIRIGRSIFFLVGALFSAITGFSGMWLAVRGNVRVAAAARETGERPAMRNAFRTGGVGGMFTISERPFPRGSILHIHFFIPPEEKLLGAFVGEVAGVNLSSRQPHGMHIRLLGYSADMKQLIAYLEERLPLLDHMV